MSQVWADAAQRAVSGLGVQAGELILVRDHAGRADVLTEVLLAIEQLGATPLAEIGPPEYVLRLLASTAPEHLATWDRHWSKWITQVDRVLTLPGGGLPGVEQYPAAFNAWLSAQARLSALEEANARPNILLSTPSARQATALGLSLDALEALLLPALAVSAATLQAETGRVLAAAGGATLTLHTGSGCTLRLALGDRRWLVDDGVIDAADRAAGSVVSNLPAGSIYTTVLEDQTEGSLWLAQAGPASDVTLLFAAGRIVNISGAGAAELAALFDRHSGEPRRVSHIGIGLNPALHDPIGWTIVDEHVHGAIFIALGENRYMGGQNNSSLNIDFVAHGANLLLDGRSIVESGRVVV